MGAAASGLEAWPQRTFAARHLILLFGSTWTGAKLKERWQNVLSPGSPRLDSDDSALVLEAVGPKALGKTQRPHGSRALGDSDDACERIQSIPDYTSERWSGAQGEAGGAWRKGERALAGDGDRRHA